MSRAGGLADPHEKATERALDAFGRWFLAGKELRLLGLVDRVVRHCVATHILHQGDLVGSDFEVGPAVEGVDPMRVREADALEHSADALGLVAHLPDQTLNSGGKKGRIERYLRK